MSMQHNNAHRSFTIWLCKMPNEWMRYHTFCGVCYSGIDEDMVIAANEKVLDGSDADMMLIAPEDWGHPGMPVLP